MDSDVGALPPPPPLVLEYASCCTIPTSWIELPVLDIQVYNHDTSIFTFEVPPGHDNLSLPTCACLLALGPGADHNGSDAIRPYTPISPGDRKQSFQLLIKRYDQWGQKCDPGSIFASFAYNTNPHSYKPKGAMSNYFFERKVGDTVQVFRDLIL
jgi:hypothetical protein